MKVRTTLLALIIVGTCAGPVAGQPAAQGSPERGDPLELLLNLRRELRLTVEQVATMRQIQVGLETANRPHVERLLEIQREVRSQVVPVAAARPGRRSASPSDAQIELARVPMRRIQENNLAAMEEINALLTDEQKRVAAEILQVERRPDERRPNRIRIPGRRE